MRGIAALSSGSTVGTYVDETPLGSNSLYQQATLFALDLLPYDIDSIEVLRGPQGTLYGAGAMGGLIKYVMKKPDTTQNEFRVGMGIADTQGADGPSFNYRARRQPRARAGRRGPARELREQRAQRLRRQPRERPRRHQRWLRRPAAALRSCGKTTRRSVQFAADEAEDRQPEQRDDRARPDHARRHLRPEQLRRRRRSRSRRTSRTTRSPSTTTWASPNFVSATSYSDVVHLDHAPT